jgi:hypothetical protein
MLEHKLLPIRVSVVSQKFYPTLAFINVNDKILKKYKTVI